MTTFTKPIDRKSSIAFLSELETRGLSYHPDDGAFDSLQGKGLSDETLAEIDGNMIASFDHVDPYVILIGLGNGFTPASSQSVVKNADLYEGEKVAMFWEWKGVLFAQLDDLSYCVLILYDEHRLQWFHEVQAVIDRFVAEEMEGVSA